MTQNQDISIKQAVEELLQTNLFKNIERRNNKQFAEKLAVWLLRYIIVVSSMKEALKIDLESVLLNIHGERFKQILEITERTFQQKRMDDDNYQSYIW
ncbi:MAG: hypothetical protein JXA91_07850 [Candidatus Thermoplasmatota archaeon]|nr:hypothetical protein [Candidatus Thermoplasmatota archaeon]